MPSNNESNALYTFAVYICLSGAISTLVLLAFTGEGDFNSGPVAKIVSSYHLLLTGSLLVSIFRSLSEVNQANLAF